MTADSTDENDDDDDDDLRAANIRLNRTRIRFWGVEGDRAGNGVWGGSHAFVFRSDNEDNTKQSRIARDRPRCVGWLTGLAVCVCCLQQRCVLPIVRVCACVRMDYTATRLIDTRVWLGTEEKCRNGEYVDLLRGLVSGGGF